MKFFKSFCVCVGFLFTYISYAPGTFLNNLESKPEVMNEVFYKLTGSKNFKDSFVMGTLPFRNSSMDSFLDRMEIKKAIDSADIFCSVVDYTMPIKIAKTAKLKDRRVLKSELKKLFEEDNLFFRQQCDNIPIWYDLTGENTIETLLGKEESKNFFGLLNCPDLDQNYSFLANMRPWLAASLLVIPSSANALSIRDAADFIDIELYKFAMSLGKNILSHHDIFEEINAVSSTLELLAPSIIASYMQNPDAHKDILKRVENNFVSKYISGDTENLSIKSILMKEDLWLANNESKTNNRLELLLNHNEQHSKFNCNLGDWILRILQENESIFIMLDVSLLVGEDGLLKTLLNNGYEIAQMPLDFETS